MFFLNFVPKFTYTIFMGGFFGVISKTQCVADLFYGTDYNSHLGTRRGGLATYSKEHGFIRSIHNLESTYFRTKFEDELGQFKGNAGVGIISDTDAQPLLMNSHLGRFAIVTVAKINNAEDLAAKLLEQGMHFSEFSSGKINPTELIALLINQGQTFVEGIEHMYKEIKGSCSLLLLTEDGIIAARDSWGRTPVVVGKKEGAYAVTGESTAFPNLDYETVYYLGPGEIVRLQAEGMECLRRPHKRMQVCSFLWVYYGFPTSCYEGKNVEEFRFACGKKMGERDRADIVVDWTPPRPEALWLCPRTLRVGVGCRRGTSEEAVQTLFDQTMNGLGLPARAVGAVCSIDLKAEEPGLLAFAGALGLPLTVYSAGRLARVEGSVSPSSFVAQVTGVDNVCERAALAEGGVLLKSKTALDGVTLALAGTEPNLDWRERA